MTNFFLSLFVTSGSPSRERRARRHRQRRRRGQNDVCFSFSCTPTCMIHFNFNFALFQTEKHSSGLTSSSPALSAVAQSASNHTASMNASSPGATKWPWGKAHLQKVYIKKNNMYFVVCVLLTCVCI